MNNLNAQDISYTIKNCPECSERRNDVYSNIRIAAGFAGMTVTYVLSRLLQNSDSDCGGDTNHVNLTALASSFAAGMLLGQCVKNLTEKFVIPVIDRECTIHVAERFHIFVQNEGDIETEGEDSDTESLQNHRFDDNIIEHPVIEFSSDEDG